MTTLNYKKPILVIVLPPFYLGQLIREDNGLLNKTYVYTYDNAGNITSKKTYALTAAGTTPTSPTATYNYGYSSSGWGDMLTSYRGVSITYDTIGNPLSYYNGANYTFSWTGRQLTGATYGENTYTFTYNDEGIRTSKTKNGVTTTYYLNGSQIMAEETNGNITVYLYDSDGMPIGMQYRGQYYADGVWDIFWYERNLQGDVIAVYNQAGTKLISYKYDAWGKPFTPTGSMANTLGKIAHGIADDALSTCVLANRAPLLLAPAMNPAMWQNPAVQENVEILRRRKVHFVGPAAGHVACGADGVGRMSEPGEIITKILELLGLTN